METVSIKMDDELFKEMKKTLKKNGYSTQTEFIREAVRERLRKLNREDIINQLDKHFGKSKRKTTDEDLEKIREKAFEELCKKRGFDLD